MAEERSLVFEPLPAGARGEKLAAVDKTWLRMDESVNRMHVHGVLVLGGDVTGAAVAEVLGERLGAIPRFRQKVATEGGRHVWVDDETFDISRHVVEERLDAPGGDAELSRAIEAQFSRPLDGRHPLWEFRVLRGYRGGETAVFARIHHAIGDGVALMVVLLAMTEPDIPGPEPVRNPFFELFDEKAPDALAEAHAAAERWMPETLRLMLAPVEAYGRLGSLARRAASVGSATRILATRNEPATPFKGALSIRKRVAWTEPLDLEEVKRTGRALGATVNELLNSTMAGALGRYLKAQKGGEARGAAAIRCAMPVNLRPLEEMAALGNRFGLAFLKLPVGIDDPLARLAAVRRHSASLKRSVEPLMVYSLLALAGRLPAFGQEMLVRIFGAKATAVFTNVPGPRNRLHLAGKELTDIFFWVPQAGRLALGVSIFSYGGRVRMGIATDAGLVPDPERIVEAFHSEWDELVARSARLL